MNTAIDYLTRFGLSARKKGYRMVVSPWSLVTDDLQKYICAHRLELLAELTANDGIARKTHWQVTIPGCRSFTMVGEPCTHEEAQSVIHSIWPEAEVTP
ncbi:hypothetical protein [Pseudomonas sp. BF-R-24]|uniref:hypothetical protein n=1 Tax=Pseudomonas sp. BF-R-24 TaxID=2832386 RepID=UPI001CBB013A|nr:hypothetical protein [Pseudomonas sp. BF-R-24]